MLHVFPKIGFVSCCLNGPQTTIVRVYIVITWFCEVKPGFVTREGNILTMVTVVLQKTPHVCRCAPSQHIIVDCDNGKWISVAIIKLSNRRAHLCLAPHVLGV